MEIKTERGLREENKQLTAELEELKGELEHALEKWRIAQGTAMERKKKIEKLEKKLEEVDVDFMRVIHAREVEKQKSRIDKLEQLCKKRLARIERLEKLCARMFRLLEMSAKFPATVSGIEPTRREMQDLGLWGGQ